ncbi:MAG: hypothetical protein HUU47_03315 [Bacteroidetes bacterium]|nr:hypothetical protein [Bacteroidota bacterium]
MNFNITDYYIKAINIILWIILFYFIFIFVFDGLTNPNLTFDEAGQFWLCKGLHHFSPLNSIEGNIIDTMKFNRIFNLDPGGLSFIGFFWLKISNSVFFIRLLPFLFSIFCVFFLYKILLELKLNSQTAFLISLFFFLSKSLVIFTFTFRAYIFEILGVLILLYLLIKYKDILFKPSILALFSIVFNIFMWTRYGFIINIIAVNFLIIFIVFDNKALNNNFIKNFLLIIVIPLILNFVFMYFYEIKYHLRGGPTSPTLWYKENLTLKHNSFFETLYNNFFCTRGLPFLFFILTIISNLKYNFFNICRNIKYIFYWMIAVHIFTIIFSFFGYYPWYIKGRWGLTLEFISLLSAIILFILIIKKIEIKSELIKHYKTTLILIMLFVLFNFRSFNYKSYCIEFLSKFNNSHAKIAFVNWYLTPETKFNLIYNPKFKKLYKTKEFNFYEYKEINKQPKKHTWFLVSDPTNLELKNELKILKFRYKFIFISSSGLILEAL